MSYQDYTGMASQLADATADKQVPQWSDIVNHKKDFLKQTTEGIGSMAVGTKAVEGIKILRGAIQGAEKAKYGFTDADLEDIQTSLAKGGQEGVTEAIGKLGSQLTNKLGSRLTDAGRNALSSVKEKLINLRSQTEASTKALGKNVTGAHSGAGDDAAEEDDAGDVDAAAPAPASTASTAGSSAAASTEETAFSTANTAASTTASTTAAGTDTAVSAAATDATETLATFTSASTSMDWNPIGWGMTIVAGLATLFGGLEIKSHKEKFQSAPVTVKSYAEQSDV